MSTYDDNQSEKPLPGVPSVTDPQPETPVTEEYDTGMANDPDVGSRTETTMEVNGHAVTVPAGSTLIDAMNQLDPAIVSEDPTEEEIGEAEVPALCHYDRDGDATDGIGPRSECRTCMVETDEHGLVPSCSFPAEEGLSVETATADAEEARSVNLDLTLSNHNLRCTTCNANGQCELQDAAISEGVDHPRYGVFGDRSEYEPLDDTSSFIQIDRNKCILCTRCVDACNDVQVQGVLRMEGGADETRIGFQSEAETMADSDCVSCGHCATVCPTGSLTEKGMGNLATLPLPGFTQRNSIGKVIEHEPVETIDEKDAPNRRFDLVDAAQEESGVAAFVRKARAQAKATGEDLGHRAMLAAEHTAEEIAVRTIPEGRLFDIAEAVSDYRLGKVDKAETTCGFCAVGCRFEMWGKDGDSLGVVPVEDPSHAPANNFSTCVKGKFGHEFANSEERLTQPLIRKNGSLQPASWDEALDLVARRFSEIQDEYGIDAMGSLASSKGSNEEAYLVQKFARQVLGSKNIDNCARLCHSSTVAALQRTVGYGAMTNRINEDIGEADAYLISGSNTTESHPVLATRIKRNVRDGADLVVFDPRKVEIAEHATQYTRTRPGNDVAWLNGLMRHIIENDLQDTAFIERNTRNYEELEEKVQAFTPEKVEELTGVAPEELVSAAETLAAADTVVFGWAMGMTQQTHGTENLLAMANLALLLGQLGKPGAGMSPFRGQNNVQGGGGDMGTLPGSLPGYQDPADDAVGEKFAASWGERPPAEPGLKVTEMFQEAHERNLRGMYVVGENPALSEPDIQHAAEALQRLDFLVVQDIFMTETAEHADVVLPAATSPEKQGTFTNTERRIQRVRATAEPPGAAKQDWEITQELAKRLGYDWSYSHPSEIMDEIAELVPIYGGVSYDRLDEGPEHGLQWPVPHADHPGTPYLYDYEDGEFNFDDGRARFVPADGGRPAEIPDEEYPMTLTSGRVLYHWHTGQITRRVEGLMSHVGESFVEVNPETATELGIDETGYVRVTSRRGSIVVRADVTDRVGPGTVFIPMHFASGAVNMLTGEAYDPIAGIPEYKISSVRVEPLEDDAEPDVLTTPDAGIVGDPLPSDD